MTGLEHTAPWEKASRVRSSRVLLTAAIVALACLFNAVFPPQACADEPASTPLVVIVVGFDGGDEGADAAVPYDEGYDWAESIFGNGDSLATYFRDMSQGAFTFAPAHETCAFTGKAGENRADRADDGVVHVTLPRTHDAWGLVNEDADIAQEFGKMVLDAFDAAGEFADFSSYDSNGDGLIAPDELAVAVYVAGYDASPFDNPDRTDIPVVWPHAGKLASDSSAQPGDVHLDSYIALAEKFTFDKGKPRNVTQEPTGILYHELGHYLGLPDLYPLNENAEAAAWGAYRVGALSLMDNGGWAEVPDGGSATGFSYEPTALDAWSRYVLGWAAPTVVTKSGDYQVASDQARGGYQSLLVPTSDPDQYFLVENRQPEGHDAGLAGEAAYGESGARGGVVIWHVDKRAYRSYCLDNEQNGTDHAPAIMELFFEADGDFFTTDWNRGTPLATEPFFDALSCEANLGSADAEIELPLYGTLDSKPLDRTGSGIRISFPSESGREMTVHIELPSATAAQWPRAFPLDAAEAHALRTGSSSLGSLACSALVRETDADVALLDAQSVKAGLPEGAVSFSDVYQVLPDDEHIVRYEMTGAQLIELAEQSLNVSDPCRRFWAVVNALRELPFGNYVPPVDEFAPDADAALSFGGLTFDIDWHGISGVRTSDASVGGSPIDPGATYTVATTPRVAAEYDLFQTLNRDTLTLWCTPAEALRSLAQAQR